PLVCATQHVFFSGDGRYLAAGCRDNSIQFWRTAAWGMAFSKPPWALEFLPMGGVVSSLAFSQNGKTLAASTFDDGTSTWRLPAEQETAAAESSRR
ncbi:MAG: hypothetical protein ACR2MW_08935, partial [Chthoniobacterales bacterium]